MMKIQIAYLNKYTQDIESLTNEILEQRDLYGDENVLIDEEEAQKLINALDGLRTAIETTHLA